MGCAGLEVLPLQYHGGGCGPTKDPNGWRFMSEVNAELAVAFRAGSDRR